MKKNFETPKKLAQIKTTKQIKLPPLINKIIRGKATTIGVGKKTNFEMHPKNHPSPAQYIIRSIFDIPKKPKNHIFGSSNTRANQVLNKKDLRGPGEYNIPIPSSPQTKKFKFGIKVNIISMMYLKIIKIFLGLGIISMILKNPIKCLKLS